MVFPDVFVFHLGVMVGEISGYQEVEVTRRWRGVDTATIRLVGVPGFLSGIPNPEQVWLDVVVMDEVPWAGHIVEMKLSFTPERGFITEIECVGGLSVLESLVLYPEPDAPLHAQSREEFQAVGVADEVVASVVGAAAARQRVPVVFSPGGSDAAGAVRVSVSGRMASVASAVGDALAGVGLALRARFWYPELGWEAPGATPGCVVVDVVAPVENTVVQWGSEDLVDGGVVMSAPSAAVMVVGGDGQGAARRYQAVVDDVVAAGMAPWGGLQRYVDAPPSKSAPTVSDDDAEDATGVDVSDSRVVGAARGAAGGVVASMSVQDDQPFRFGHDYMVGDVVSAEVAGVRVWAQVTEVTVTVTFEGGRKVTPKVGEKQTSPISELVGMVADLAKTQDYQARMV